MFSSFRKTYAPPPRASGSLSRLVFAAVFGAAAMYLLDPDNGKRRRALVKDKFKAPQPVDDGVLIERVRAALGHVLPNVNAIDVKVREGTVILKGPVTPDEMSEIVACAERVRGVQQVENRLSPNSMGTSS